MQWGATRHLPLVFPGIANTWFEVPELHDQRNSNKNSGLRKACCQSSQASQQPVTSLEKYLVSLPGLGEEQQILYITVCLHYYTSCLSIQGSLAVSHTNAAFGRLSTKPSEAAAPCLSKEQVPSRDDTAPPCRRDEAQPRVDKATGTEKS